MKNQLAESMRLAWRDWKFEFLLSFCSVIALASMLVPVLVLQGLKNGVIQGMRERLLQDPAVLVITPKSDAGRFSAEFIGELAALPEAAFAIGRTRDTATDITLENPERNARASVSLEPAAQGEPVLERYGQPVPEDGSEPGLVLSASAARALKIEKGGVLEAKLGRKTPQGRLESVALRFHVAGILPPEAADRGLAFTPLPFLEALEDYRDYLAVPERNFTGNPNAGKRQYASFRLYARELDSVEKLAGYLEEKHIEVLTSAREIAAIRLLENSINQIILIISAAVGAGFAAFTLSSVQGSVSRKKRMLGMLRLLGFRRGPLMLYPFVQTMLTAFCGFCLSLLLYLCVSLAIDQAFSGGGMLCNLGLADIGLFALAIVLLSSIASAKAAYASACIEPSAVIREV